LESYAYSMKQTVEDEKVKDKISEEDKKTIMDKCSDNVVGESQDEVEYQLPGCWQPEAHRGG